MTPYRLLTPFPRLPMIFLALLALALQGCSNGGDGGGPGVTPDADPAGYYINTGTASVDDSLGGGTLVIPDLQAMVHGERIMMMSVENKLLYDGTITEINGNDFSADFTIYTGGRFPVTATASGTITEGSSITGTLTGSGVGSGTFTLLYDNAASNTVADIARIDNEVGVNTTWQGRVGGSFALQELVINNEGKVTEDDFSGGGIFTSCELEGILTPISGSSLYDASVTTTGCGASIYDGTYTGLATSRTDADTDDTLVFAATDGRYSLDGDFK